MPKAQMAILDSRILLARLEYWPATTYDFDMSSETEELVRICESLPESKRAEVTDFARFLLDREQDERWEGALADSRPRPKLDDFVRSAMAEGSEPLDPEKL